MSSLYFPLLGQASLTFLVWFVLVFYRVYVLQVRRIHPQVVADEAKNQEIYRSGVHLTNNSIRLRFGFYVLSTGSCIGLWARLATQLFQ